MFRDFGKLTLESQVLLFQLLEQDGGVGVVAFVHQFLLLHLAQEDPVNLLLLLDDLVDELHTYFVEVNVAPAPDVQFEVQQLELDLGRGFEVPQLQQLDDVQ